ncbi:MAG: SLBB domain-containing protein [candidate division Zixibacteria bacterium]|nr:SLBB domain-containing protein [candidate division Zixibacteria bacterium]
MPVPFPRFSLRCLTALLVFLLLAVAFPFFAHAQRGIMEGVLRDGERQNTRRTPTATRGLTPSLFDPNVMQQDIADLRLLTPPLERPIDPDTYRLGPGDHLLISMTEIGSGFAVTVTPEGLLAVPTVGEFPVAGLALTAVKKLVEQRARPKFHTGNISTILLYPRQFRITVAGSVNNPGQIVATPIDRVSDILYLTNRIPEEMGRMAASDSLFVFPSARGSDRNIQIRRQDGSSVRVDLRRYLTSGRLEDNPPLTDGDVVFVPVRNAENGTVALSGAVNLPGIYEYAEGDNLRLLLDLAGGLSDVADRSRVEIARTVFRADGTVVTETISVDLTQGQRALDTPIQARDRIFVRTAVASRARHVVTVKGEVRYPGVYPTPPDGVLLTRLIDLAGGFTEDAYIAGGKALRPLDPGASANDPTMEKIARLRMSRIDPQEIADFETQAVFRQQALVADFDRLFRSQDFSTDIRLQHGDIVVIPSRNETVRVAGQVASPGQISFGPEKKLDDYIREAGGLGKHARRSHIRIIKAETFDWMTPDRTSIEIGDMIWVPRNPRRDYYAIFKETLSVTATLTTLYLVLQQIAK